MDRYAISEAERWAHLRHRGKISSMENLLTVDDLSQKLQVSRVWIYKLVREKRIPFYHIEKCVRFSPEEIREWLEVRKSKEWHRDRN